MRAGSLQSQQSARERTVVTVGVKGGAYDVHVGPGAVDALAWLVPPGVGRAAVVTQRSVGVEVELPCETAVFEVPQGETAKSIATVEDLCRSWSRFGLTRRDLVVAVGGGVVTDLAGFAASVYHRGVRYLNVATTLLAQVDAAIGGKTGVNLPEGKNLVGSFHHPVAVVCDTDHLATLPDSEMRSGLGEVAKYSLIRLPGTQPVEAERWGEVAAATVVARCVAVKAAVVADDEQESSGARAVLNYGHTLAHALEASGMAGGGDGQIRHGEAVAIGLVFAARLAERMGRISTERVAEHLRVVRALGLPESLPVGCRAGELVAFMRADKKAMFSVGRSGLTFVLDGPDGVELVGEVSEDEVVALLEEMGS